MFSSMKEVVEYRTTDTDELAPYPDMMSDDLRDFEVWSDEVFTNWDVKGRLLLVLAWCGLAWAVVEFLRWLT